MKPFADRLVWSILYVMNCLIAVQRNSVVSRCEFASQFILTLQRKYLVVQRTKSYLGFFLSCESSCKSCGRKRRCEQLSAMVLIVLKRGVCARHDRVCVITVWMFARTELIVVLVRLHCLRGGPTGAMITDEPLEGVQFGHLWKPSLHERFECMLDPVYGSEQVCH